MKDDFDSGMGIPDDELTGGSGAADTGGAEPDAEMDEAEEPMPSAGAPGGSSHLYTDSTPLP